MKVTFLLAAAGLLTLDTFAGEADTKVLIVYYSKTGNTERVAKDVAAALGADVEKLADKKKRTGIWGFLTGGRDAMKKRKTELGPLQRDPAGYDLVVVGTPVWAGNITPAVRTYLDMKKDKLKQTAYIVTAGGASADKIIPFCEEVTGKKPVAYAGFVEKELKDDKVYREKLGKFIGELKGLEKKD